MPNYIYMCDLIEYDLILLFFQQIEYNWPINNINKNFLIDKYIFINLIDKFIWHLKSPITIQWIEQKIIYYFFTSTKKKIKDYIMCSNCKMEEKRFVTYAKYMRDIQEDIILYNNVLHYIIIIKLWMFMKKLNIYELKKWSLNKDLFFKYYNFL